MKKTLACILLVACVFTLSSCFGGEKTLSCTIPELFVKISAVNSEGELFAYDSERLLDELGIKSDLYTEGSFMAPVESANIEVIAFFKAADKDKATELKASLDKYVTATRVYEEKYNADNYEIAKNAVTKTEGLYVYLVMSAKKADIISVIGNNLK